MIEDTESKLQMTSEAKAQLSPVEIFMKSWSVYQEVIQHNYMFHREIIQSVKNYLVATRAHDLIKILDLGCGDASMDLPLVSLEHVKTYVGCDLSQPALDIAHQHLLDKGVPHQCICDDMLKVASEQPNESFDLALSSYALHHLNSLQKQQIVRDVFRMLKPGGCFVLIDIFREAEEDRPAYIRNYMGYLRSNWTNLSKNSQRKYVRKQVNTNQTLSHCVVRPKTYVRFLLLKLSSRTITALPAISQQLSRITTEMVIKAPTTT
ncbi:MAG: hypothetical protein EoVTN8_617 [Fluviibacter phosphoraccumulans EoVTN8]